jgi:uncharacterized membrane-anchored protein YitT (DUF2179 family)
LFCARAREYGFWSEDKATKKIGDIVMLAGSVLLTVTVIIFAFALRRMTLWLSALVLKRVEHVIFNTE